MTKYLSLRHSTGNWDRISESESGLPLPRHLLVFLVLSAISISYCGCREELPGPAPRPAPQKLPDEHEQDELQLSSVFDLTDKTDHLISSGTEEDSASIQGPVFLDISVGSGMEHVYQTGDYAHLLMVQPTGGGCGWVDYDSDGLWDLYLNQGGNPTLPPSPDQPTDRLFRNIGGGKFRDVTDFAGIDERDYSQGVAIGDFDNDGFDDIFVSNAGPDRLFKNQGDGTYLDVTAETLVQPSAWSSSAAWGDVDRDGDLDLYVCRYLDFDRFHPQPCFTASGQRKMCEPNEVEAIPDEFYLNEGNGGFRAAAHESGLFGAQNKALGVAISDFNNDGWLDVYVANDATPNYLFINQRDGSFVDQAVLLGCAVSWEGRSQASMGVAVGDYDRNGYLDVYLSHYEGEWNTLYQNMGPQGFIDASSSTGGVSPTLPMVGFGTVMEDFDQDGHADLIVANGHLDDPGHLRVDLAMYPQLFSFRGARFVDCSLHGGAYFSQKAIGRGLATADVDLDGDLDVVVVNQNSRAALLQNDSTRGNWLQLEFLGVTSNRRGIGTRVSVELAGDSFVGELSGGTSYCSAQQPCISFGFGNRAGKCHLDVRWPGGVRQRIENVDLNQSLRLTEPRDRPRP